MAKQAGKSEASVDVAGFLARLNGETPRGRILLEAGLLEELLRGAILKRLAENKSSEELFGEKCILGLTVLAKYAHALALIGDHELAALKLFADARNRIAHSWKTDFTEPEIQKISEKMQIINVLGEASVDPDQKCFARLDYFGAFMTEELFNRFSAMPPTAFVGGVFMTSLVVDPVTGNRTKKVATQK